MYDNEIAIDKAWLDEQLENFGQSSIKRRLTTAKEFAAKKALFKKLFAATVFDEDANGKKLEKPVYFTLDQFDQTADPKSKKARNREDLLTLWQQYLANLKYDTLTESQKAIIGRQRMIATSLATVAGLQAFPANVNSEWEKHYWSCLGRGFVPVGSPSISGVNPYAPRPFAPSSSVSTAISAILGFAAGAGMSFLLNSASRAVICTAMGFVGLPGSTIVLAGATAALVTAGKNIFKNRHVIADRFNAAEGNFFNKLGAGAVATGKAVNIKQVLINGGVAAAASFGGGIVVSGLMHGFSEVAACIGHQFGIDLVPADHVNVLNDQLQDLRSGLSHEHAAGVALETRLDHLDAIAANPPAMSAAPVLHPPVDVQPLKLCPVSASDHAPTFHDLRDAFHPADHAAIPVAPVPDIHMLAPDSSSIKVVEGDNLTDLIEKHYGITEGSENFDKVMTELAKSNGLAGAQENWLKIGWKLELPSLNPETVTANIDRPMLDANWRAAEVVYSNVPKMAVPA